MHVYVYHRYSINSNKASSRVHLSDNNLRRLQIHHCSMSASTREEILYHIVTPKAMMASEGKVTYFN